MRTLYLRQNCNLYCIMCNLPNFNVYQRVSWTQWASVIFILLHKAVYLCFYFCFTNKVRIITQTKKFSTMFLFSIKELFCNLITYQKNAKYRYYTETKQRPVLQTICHSDTDLFCSNLYKNNTWLGIFILVAIRLWMQMALSQYKLCALCWVKPVL